MLKFFLKKLKYTYLFFCIYGYKNIFMKKCIIVYPIYKYYRREIEY